ncbi:MAG TPA: hypothetical protein VGD59_11705 [Acidisarcina sp.]
MREPVHTMGTYDREIDAALLTLAHAQPRPGLEERLLCALAAGTSAPASLWWQRVFQAAEWRWLWRRLNPHSQIAMATLAASLAAVAVLVAGGAFHPRVPLAPAGPSPTRLTGQPLPSAGFGAAGAARVPANALHAAHLAPGGHARGSRRSKEGRAVLPLAPSHRAPGIAAPRSPYPGR